MTPEERLQRARDERDQRRVRADTALSFLFLILIPLGLFVLAAVLHWAARELGFL